MRAMQSFCLHCNRLRTVAASLIMSELDKAHEVGLHGPLDNVLIHTDVIVCHSQNINRTPQTKNTD